MLSPNVTHKSHFTKRNYKLFFLFFPEELINTNPFWSLGDFLVVLADSFGLLAI